MGHKIAKHDNLVNVKVTDKKCAHINNNKCKSVPLKVAVNNSQCKEDVANKNKYWPLLAINDHDSMCETENAVDSSSEIQTTADLIVCDRKSYVKDSHIKVGVGKHSSVSCGDDGIVTNPDKYELHLCFCSQVKNILSSNRNAPIFQKWEDQVVDKYGFIPLSELLIPNRNDQINDVINAHQTVAKTRTFNFMKAEIQV